MKAYWLILGVLAVWRLTHLLNAEDGPWGAMVRLRELAETGFWAGLLDCFYCLSLWMSAPLAYLIGDHWMERIVLWPALSGAAILLERLAPDRTIAAAPDYEMEENFDVLRHAQAPVADDQSPGERGPAGA